MNTLSPTWQKTLKFFHHLSVLGWSGGLLASWYILFQLQGAADAISGTSLNLLLFNIAYKIITPLFLFALVTGLLFALFTKYGFFRFYWIIGKWVLLVIAYLVFSFLYLPELHIMAALSDLGAETAKTMGMNYTSALNKVYLASFINLALVLGILILTGFKPWGIRKRAGQFKSRPRARAFIISTIIIVAIFGTISEVRMWKMRNIPVEPVDLSSIISDTYTGEYHSYFDFKVKVILEDGVITEIDVLNDLESLYARLAEGVIYKIMDEQRVDVDAVTGATTTSVALQKAVEYALRD